ncbi:MAG: hypothetical protein B7Z57_06575 [Acidiphilium sp. 37-60-79]|nr:MAG: hypothetical protein B7Z57_06575 [Acidiphilium sp. 37-60-79]
MMTTHPQASQFGGDLLLADPAVMASQDGPATTFTSYRAEAVDPSRPETWVATPRNALCPCGSGKKYKHCHGKA